MLLHEEIEVLDTWKGREATPHPPSQPLCKGFCYMNRDTLSAQSLTLPTSLGLTEHSWLQQLILSGSVCLTPLLIQC